MISWGYPSEEYDVVTEDGYVLQINKIPYGRGNAGNEAFIAFSTMPQLAEKIKMYFALAPVATVTFIQSLLKKFTFFSGYGFKEMFGTKEFLPHTTLGELLRSKFCAYSKTCRNFLSMLFGFNWKNINMSRVDGYVAHAPAETSVQNVIHWMQGVQSGALRAYDEGNVYNNHLYRQMDPPLYYMRDMKVPTAIWSGCLADPQDVALLLPQITGLVRYRAIPEWNHTDFLLCLDATQVLYQETVYMMKKNP